MILFALSGEKLIENPERYRYRGEWLEVEVDYQSKACMGISDKNFEPDFDNVKF